MPTFQVYVNNPNAFISFYNGTNSFLGAFPFNETQKPLASNITKIIIETNASSELQQELKPAIINVINMVLNESASGSLNLGLLKGNTIIIAQSDIEKVAKEAEQHELNVTFEYNAEVVQLLGKIYMGSGLGEVVLNYSRAWNINIIYDYNNNSLTIINETAPSYYITGNFLDIPNQYSVFLYVSRSPYSPVRALPSLAQSIQYLTFSDAFS